MKPVDMRLVRSAQAARSVFVWGALLGLLRTLAIMLWCWSLAQMLAAVALTVFPNAPAAVRDGAIMFSRGEATIGQNDGTLILGGQFTPFVLAAVVALVVRSGTQWLMDIVAARGAILAKAQLRSVAFETLDTASPLNTGGMSRSERVTLLGRGLDALDGYFSGYLPQLILAVVSTPLLVLAVLLTDTLSGVTVLIVFPVIPLFMVLIGMATRSVQQKQWAQLQHLSAAFLDVVSGLATLKIFRREHRQTTRIRRESEEYRRRTMQVLRVTFLSGFVLDLAGTFSIALVAVTVGTRLVSGEFSLAHGLFVLLLLPEVFVPIRQVGAAFHASTEGLEASAALFDWVERTRTPQHAELRTAAGSAQDPDPVENEPYTGDAVLQYSAVEVTRDSRLVVGPVSFDVYPGEVVALAGPSGSGKSTLLAAALRFLAPTAGAVRLRGAAAWVPQQAGLLRGTVAANVALGAEEIDGALVRQALAAAGLEEIDPETCLGAAGSGLSGGQAQRVSIARALYRCWSERSDVLLLDEPTSALDRENETIICALLRREADRGCAVLVASHREAVLQTADRVVVLPSEHREQSEGDA